MNAVVGRLALAIGILFIVFPGILMIVNEPGSEAFVVSGFTLIIGLIFATIAVVLIRISARSDRSDR